MSLSSDIETHIEILMDDTELEKIGADKQPQRDLQLRIMRILVAYNNLQTENKRLKEIIDSAKTVAVKAKNAKEYYDNLIECRFVELPPIAKILVNQIGKDIEQALKGTEAEDG